MRITRWIATGAAAALVATTLTLAAPALADNTTDDPSAPDTSVGWSDLCLDRKLLAVRRLAPDDLKTALAEAWRLSPGPERRDALRQIRDDERSGVYGPQVQRFATTRQDAWISAWRSAPEDFKEAVSAISAMEPGDQRRQAAKDLWDKALAGDYGVAIRERAEHLRACRES